MAHFPCFSVNSPTGCYGLLLVVLWVQLLLAGLLVWSLEVVLVHVVLPGDSLLLVQPVIGLGLPAFAVGGLYVDDSHRYSIFHPYVPSCF